MRVLALLLLGLAVQPAAAALLAACTLQPAALAFPAYDLSRVAPTDSQTSVSLRCIAIGGVPGTLAYELSLSRSATSGSYARQLGFGLQRLNYNLYADAGRLQVWGDGSGGTTKVAGSLNFNLIGLGINASHLLYARMPAQQVVGGGAYSDSLTLTIEY